MDRRAQMDDGARSAAIGWLIRLQEQPDDQATGAALRAWLAADPAHAEAWAKTSALGDLIAQIPPQAPRAGRKPLHRTRRAIAAALAVAAAMAFVLLSDLPLRATADYSTGTAERRVVTLPDGSTAQLAPESAIDVDYAAGERKVRLRAGTAFFEVVRDPARPFRVLAGEVETTVLGTAFDVRLTAEETDVAVRRGAVAVEKDGVRAQLGPGDWIRETATGALRGKGPREEAGAWLRGELVARDAPIADVVDALRPYFAGAILVPDDALAQRRVTGLYDLGDPAATLRAVALTQGAKVRQITPWILVLSKN
jgi:transmembrane sensor